jgi:hypothetical protein
MKSKVRSQIEEVKTKIIPEVVGDAKLFPPGFTSAI